MSLTDEKENDSLVRLNSRSAMDSYSAGGSMSQDQVHRANPNFKTALSEDDALLLESESDYSSVLRLIQKASDAIDTLQNRCRGLENEVLATNERLQEEAALSERVIHDWEQLAAKLKVRLTAVEADYTAALQKVKSTEERANSADIRAQASETRLQESYTRAHHAEARATAAEKRIAREIELATSFKQKIVETFGTDSKHSSVLGS